MIHVRNCICHGVYMFWHCICHVWHMSEIVFTMVYTCFDITFDMFIMFLITHLSWHMQLSKISHASAHIPWVTHTVILCICHGLYNSLCTFKFAYPMAYAKRDFMHLPWFMHWFMHIQICISHGLCTHKKKAKKKSPEAAILTKTVTCTCINHGLCTKNAF